MHEFIIHLISLYDFSVVSWRTSTSHEPQYMIVVYGAVASTSLHRETI